MPTAYIVITQGILQTQPGFSTDQLVLNTPVVLTNANDTGVTTWFWQFADLPQNSSAVISNPTHSVAGFTPDVPGTYLIRLSINGGVRTSQVGAAVKTLNLRYRIPAITEEFEFDNFNTNQKGWGPAINKALQIIDDGYGLSSYGSGADGYITFWNGAKTLTGNSNLTFDNTYFISGTSENHITSIFWGDVNILANIDTFGPSGLNIAGTNSTSVNIGHNGINTNILGNLVVNHSAIFDQHIEVDGYSIDFSGGASQNQFIAYNGTSFVPTTINQVSFPTDPSPTIVTWKAGQTKNNFFTIDPHDENPAWGMGLASYANNNLNPDGHSETRTDDVLVFGWNMSPQGEIDPTKGSVGWSMESYYLPGAGSGDASPQTETYLSWGNGQGRGGRAISFNQKVGPWSNTNILALHADSVQLGSGTNTSSLPILTISGSADDGSGSSINIRTPDGSRQIYLATGQAGMRTNGAHNIYWDQNGLSVDDDLRPTGSGQGNVGLGHDNPALGLYFSGGAFSQGITIGGFDTSATPWPQPTMSLGSDPKLWGSPGTGGVPSKLYFGGRDSLGVYGFKQIFDSDGNLVLDGYKFGAANASIGQALVYNGTSFAPQDIISPLQSVGSTSSASYVTLVSIVPQAANGIYTFNVYASASRVDHSDFASFVLPISVSVTSGVPAAVPLELPSVLAVTLTYANPTPPQGCTMGAAGWRLKLDTTGNNINFQAASDAGAAVNWTIKITQVFAS